MDDLPRKQYAMALRKKEAELVYGLTHRDGLATESEADLFDEIQNAVDRALVVQVLDRSTALLRDVRRALQRIGDGTYGRCLRCEGEINAKRLTALPWAPLCLMCQEDADREEHNTTDFDLELVSRVGGCRV